jgi:hypothetical protein
MMSAFAACPPRGAPRWAEQPNLIGHFMMRMPVTPMASSDFLARNPVKEPVDLQNVPHKRNLPKIRALRDWLLDCVRQAAGDNPYGILEEPAPVG